MFWKSYKISDEPIMIDGWDFWNYLDKKTSDEDDDVFKRYDESGSSILLKQKLGLSFYFVSFSN